MTPQDTGAPPEPESAPEAATTPSGDETPDSTPEPAPLPVLTEPAEGIPPVIHIYGDALVLPVLTQPNATGALKVL